MLAHIAATCKVGVLVRGSLVRPRTLMQVHFGSQCSIEQLRTSGSAVPRDNYGGAGELHLQVVIKRPPVFAPACLLSA